MSLSNVMTLDTGRFFASVTSKDSDAAGAAKRASTKMSAARTAMATTREGTAAGLR